MKRPCVRCLLLYALAAPPLIGYLMLRKIMRAESFAEAATGLQEKIDELTKLGAELENMLKRTEEAP